VDVGRSTRRGGVAGLAGSLHGEGEDGEGDEAKALAAGPMGVVGRGAEGRGGAVEARYESTVELRWARSVSVFSPRSIIRLDPADVRESDSGAIVPVGSVGLCPD
jgi:hypothetical protein